MLRTCARFAVKTRRARGLRLNLCSGHKHLLLWVILASICMESSACRPPKTEPVTLTLLDQGWVSADLFNKRGQILAEFTRRTGVAVRILPSPETAIEQLALWKSFLSQGLESPDVFGVDVIWPVFLQEYLIDLTPYFEQETSRHFPILIDAFTVNGKLVAIPARGGFGVLAYRTDLLKKYGFKGPPKTWDELEQMAKRIQAGERSNGNKNFWGFVWQGGAAEALTCNALEWQAGDGAGQLIEKDGTISVNNPLTVRAWERAAHWVGSISPPGVVAYTESDALNVWLSGEAAFMRSWPPVYGMSKSVGSSLKDNYDVALLPGGIGTLGGSGLGVSRYTPHTREAVELVRFLTSRETQSLWTRTFSDPPTMPDLYDDRAVAEVNPYLPRMREPFLSGVVLRPSKVTGLKYEDVSRAYFEAVHQVLTGRKKAGNAAAELEKKLIQITGFHKGSPPARRTEDLRKKMPLH